MRTASRPALAAPPMPMVATGTPLGICTREISESSPFTALGKKEELTALGFNDYLRKPFLEKELLDILGLHLPLEYTHDSDTSPQYQDEKKQPLSTREIVHLIHQLPTPLREELCTAVEFQDVDSIESLVRQPEFMAYSPELTSIFTKAVLLSDYKLLVSIDSLMQSE